MKGRLLIVVAAMVAFVTTASPAQVTADWRLVSAGNAFTFLAPPDTVPYSDGGQAIDSFVGMYRNSKFTLMFDYGQYSNNLSELSMRAGYQTDHARIDGRDAVIVSGRAENFDGCNNYMSAVYIVVSHSVWSGETTRIMMSGCVKNKQGLPALRTVFQSLRFSSD